MNFEILGKISDIEIIAVGTAIRELSRLKKIYGPGRWRELKGIATIRTADSGVGLAEVQ